MPPVTKQKFEVALGDVFRMKVGLAVEPDAWSDMIVTRINDDGETVDLDRPYAYADTLSKRVVLSVEPVRLVRIASLEKHYRRIARRRCLSNSFDDYERGRLAGIAEANKQKVK